MTVTLTGVSIGFGGVAFGGVQIYSPALVPPTPTQAPQHATPFPKKRSSDEHAPHYPRYRSDEEIRRERDKLWGVEEKAEEIVEKVARKVIARAEASEKQLPAAREAAEVDPLEWLAAHHEQERKRLEADLRRKKIDWGIQYWILLKLEVERQWQQEREDEQILSLLLSM